MTNWVIVQPVLPGKTDELRKMGDYVRSHAKDYQESRRRAGLTVERGYLMNTPMGEFVTVYFEGTDLMKAFDTFANSNAPFDKYFMERLRDIHGTDPSQRPPAPEPLIEFVEDRGARKNGIAWSLPVLSGKTDDVRRFSKELSTTRRNEFFDSRRSKGFTRNVAFLNHGPHGDAVAVYAEGDDIATAVQKLSSSNAPFDVWFRDQIRSYSGVDFSRPMPPITTIIDSLQLSQSTGATARA